MESMIVNEFINIGRKTATLLTGKILRRPGAFEKQ